MKVRAVEASEVVPDAQNVGGGGEDIGRSVMDWVALVPRLNALKADLQRTAQHDWDDRDGGMTRPNPIKPVPLKLVPQIGVDNRRHAQLEEFLTQVKQDIV